MSVWQWEKIEEMLPCLIDTPTRTVLVRRICRRFPPRYLVVELFSGGFTYLDTERGTVWVQTLRTADAVVATLRRLRRMHKYDYWKRRAWVRFDLASVLLWQRRSYLMAKYAIRPKALRYKSWWVLDVWYRQLDRDDKGRSLT